jgi:hypothetical protein
MVTTGISNQTIRVIACIALLTSGLSGCCLHRQRTGEQTAMAAERAARTLQGQYEECFPMNYDANALLTDLKANQFDEESLGTLQAVQLEVQTNADCSGYFLIARSCGSDEVLAWDDASDLLSVEGVRTDEAPAPPIPDHPAPQSCTCNTDAPPGP